MLKKFITLDYSVDLLEHLCGMLLDGSQLERKMVIFPGKRPALYLRKKLSLKLGRDFLPPQILSLSELINRCVEPAGREIDSSEGSFLLYKFLNELPSGPLQQKLSSFRSFSAFFYWGLELFRLFEEFLSGSIGETEIRQLSEAQEFAEAPPEALYLWKNMGEIFSSWCRMLDREKLHTAGLLCRRAGDLSRIELPGVDQIIFASFYSLTASEQKLFRRIMESRPSVYLAQCEPADQVVLNLSRSFETTQERVSSILKKPAVTHHQATSVQHEMVLLRELLRGSGDLSDCAVVMPRSESLIPFLWETADYLDQDYNVSLTYPLKRTPFYSLLERIMQVQETRVEEKYYSRNFLSLFSHPYVKSISFEGQDPSLTRMVVQNLAETFEKKQLQFFSISELPDLLKPDLRTSHNGLPPAIEERLLHFLLAKFIRNFEAVSSLAGLFSGFKSMLLFLSGNSDSVHYYFAPEFLESFLTLFSSLEKSCLSEYEAGSGKSTDLFNIFRHLAEQTSVNFRGVPLKGYQVLGLFETRSLKFGRVFFLDLNDDVLPSVRKYEALISPALRKAAGLPTYRDRELLYRHYFRAAVQGSGEAHLFHLTGADKVKSRFVEEFIWEQEKVSGRLSASVFEQAFPVRLKKDTGLKIFKDEIMKTLSNMTFSPSKVDTYLNCPLSFYFKYLAHFRDLAEESQAVALGSLVHTILERLFTGVKNLNHQEIRRLQDILPRIIDTAYSENYPILEGEILIGKKLVEKRLEDLLKLESRRFSEIPGRLVGLEHEIRGEFPHGGLRFQGKLDRVEKQGFTLRIIDYKTGNVDFLKPRIREILESDSPISERTEMKRLIRSFQLPLYLHLIREEETASDLDACWFAIKQVELVSIFGKTNPKEKEELLDRILDSCRQLTAEMLDPETPFENQCRDAKECGSCSFRHLCGG
ncbi:MAG: PD-(D/E)XK nuclease family protein [Candidatus Wallbacteria bacterium]|nr:PD-(D/E)XK nuclease family protein [Candidatus Wallbacteria bacterium]